MFRSALVCLVLGAGAMGCAGGPGSCSQMQSGSMACVEYTGQAISGEVVQQYCTMAMGTYSGGGCTSANRVGRCAYPTGPITQTFSFYAPLTTEQAMMTCSRFTGSTFTPG